MLARLHGTSPADDRPLPTCYANVLYGPPSNAEYTPCSDSSIFLVDKHATKYTLGQIDDSLTKAQLYMERRDKRAVPGRDIY